MDETLISVDLRPSQPHLTQPSQCNAQMDNNSLSLTFRRVQYWIEHNHRDLQFDIHLFEIMI